MRTNPFSIDTYTRRETNRIEWRCSRDNYYRCLEMYKRLAELEYANQADPAVRDEAQALHDDILSLPGFPQHWDPNRDMVVPVTTTVRR